ncbi:hypothetical protein [Sphingomonas sp.]|uniref:hypothetical protein n=1 Tax=Sphingomonas sp. TaxID=28214 RepID=UPI0025EB53AB|nr:hypothetical protein [Sphingomonas sp.]MBV9528596.1 hypothetical protein [Sphingomonas sp.]
MTEDAGSKKEFERMIARHKVDIERAQLEAERFRREFDERLERMRDEMDAARNEIECAIGRGQDPLHAARRYLDRWGIWPEPVRRKRKPPRRFDGGEPVPVEPRPKPKPLMDGAEAPIE